MLWASDNDGKRLPVVKAEALQRLHASDQPDAARLVAAIADTRGVLDEAAVDSVFLAVHLELARLSEFVHVPQRIAHSLRPIVARLRATGQGPVHVVDLGCGLGYDTRALAATRALGDGVSFTGLDFNDLLVEAAKRLAAAEDIPVDFRIGNALDPEVWTAEPDRTILVSSALLHHVGRDSLTTFFAHTARTRVAAFAHFDISPGLWANVGGWVLHHTRMREPISRHDGTMSMRRAFTSTELLDHAAAGTAGEYTLRCDTVTHLFPRPEQIVRPVIGLCADLGTMP